jgi:predicted flavoprotein YhiN
LSNRLRKVGLSKSAVGLLLECGARTLATTNELAHMIQYVVVPVIGVASIDRAISSSGGVMGTMINDDGMLKLSPGTFVAGEMLDWDAPTGGYLLQGCWSTGCRVGDAVARYVGR